MDRQQWAADNYFKPSINLDSCTEVIIEEVKHWKQSHVFTISFIENEKYNKYDQSV